jgi:hypothetical protein
MSKFINTHQSLPKNNLFFILNIFLCIFRLIAKSIGVYLLEMCTINDLLILNYNLKTSN